METRLSAANADRLERLQAVTDAALAHLEVEELLRVLLPRIRDILGADTCAVLLLDEETDELVARAAVGIEEEVEAGVRIPVGGGFAGRVAAGKRPVVLDDIDEADVLNPILREKGIKSMLGVPLLVAGGVIGVLHVGTLHRRRFDADDVDLLQLAADRAAVALEHARLFEAERRARRRIEHVQVVTDAALAHLELDELLEVLLPRIRDILVADTCAVLLLDRETDELVARAALGIEEEVVAGVRIPMGGGFAGRVAATKQPVIIDDLATYPVLNPILREKGIESMLGVPLLIGAGAIGVIHVGTLVPRRFSHDDVELLQLVAQRVALAIERAQLHEQTRQFDQLKLNFVAIASHELRTPATSIYGALTTLVHRLELPAETRDELIEMAYQQSDRMRRLIEQLLDLSRLDARAIRVAPRPIVLSSVIGEIVAGAVPPGAGRRPRCSDGSRRGRQTRSCSNASSRTCSRTPSATEHRRSASRRCARRRACGCWSRTPAPGYLRICVTGCSTASPARTRESAVASASRSHARTPRQRAVSSSTARARSVRGSS